MNAAEGSSNEKSPKSSNEKSPNEKVPKVETAHDDIKFNEEESTALPFGVVFLHGLGGYRNELSYIESGIRLEFGDRAVFITPASREAWRSIVYSASFQVRGIVKDIKQGLSDQGKDSTVIPLIIIGYSEGAKLAFKLLKEYYKELNIVGINSINGALSGAHLLTCSREDVRAFMCKGKDGLKLFNCPSSISAVQRNMSLLSSALTMFCPKWVPAPVYGVKDMIPGSASIRDICNFIRSGAYGIPCFLIATHQNDFGELFNINTPEHSVAIEHYNKAYSKFITGKEGRKHDTLLSLPTQLGRGDSLEDITGDENPVFYVQPGHSNITGHIYSGKTHAGNLVPIDFNLFFPENVESAVTSEVIREDVIEFIQRALKGFGEEAFSAND